jgi:hypothetical protein
MMIQAGNRPFFAMMRYGWLIVTAVYWLLWLVSLPPFWQRAFVNALPAAARNGFPIKM